MVQSVASSSVDYEWVNGLKKLKARWIVLVAIVLLWLGNTSVFSGPSGNGPVLIAHRGLAQSFSRDGLTGETCTAARMIQLDHPYLENTIPSMRAAYDLGTDFVEFDVHRTSDDQFVVFHDWTVDCRTEGQGVTHELSMDSLRVLDIGYGYTADSGQTFPFRGQGVGMMPTMEDVLDAFPNHGLIIDMKSQEREDGIAMADRLSLLSPARQQQIMVYGGGGAVSVVRERLPAIKTIWRARLKTCLVRYIALGWTGHVPASCERSMVTVPANVAPWLWGWPHRFQQRMEEAGSMVILIGDYTGETYSTGLDDPDRISTLPDGYAGGIWTDRIDLIAPISKRGNN